MRTRQPNAWQQSAQWRAISREAIKRFNAQRWKMPKCGARRKSDGQPCQQLAGENGRCYLHGSRTGSGANWHVRQFPKGSTPTAEVRLQRKLAQIERDQRRLKKRLATFTADERKRYEEWHRTHQPGPPGPRARRRAERLAAARAREAFSRPDDRVPSPEIQDLQKQIAQIEAERDRVLNQIKAENAMQEVIANPVGVFQ